MRSSVFIVLMAFLGTVPLAAQNGLLVSADWLMEHIGDPDVVVLHVASSRRDYAPGHIPGSHFVWWDAIAPSTPDYATELPSKDAMQGLLRELGIGRNSRIIVAFGGRSITSGTRALWTLQYFGLADRSSLLDGGVEAWKAAGGELSADIPSPAKGDIELTATPEVFANLAFVKENRNTPGVTIVDARSKVYYDGRPAGQPRGGHVQGAVNVPYSEVVDSLNRFKSEEQLREIFGVARVAKGGTVVTYCHIGQQASVTLLAARLLGYKVRLYDGSFEEWGYMDEDYPVEKENIPE